MPDPGLTTDLTDLVDALRRHAHRFGATKAHSPLDGAIPRSAELRGDAVPADLREAAIAAIATPVEPTSIAIVRHRPGDYSLPFEPVDLLGPVDWCVYRGIGDSVLDGLTYWNGEEFRRVFDVDATTVDLAPDSWCWTSPVREGARHTILVGGRR